MKFKSVSFFILILSFWGCVPFQKSNVKITSASKNSQVKEMSISSVQIINNQLVVNGNNLDAATTLKVSGISFDESFTIESQSRSQIIANSIRAFSFDVSKVFSLIISNANASATFPIDFSLCNSTLNGIGFNCSVSAMDKDVLSYDANTGKWKPRAATGINYLGAFNASTNPPVPTPTPFPSAGSYYIVSADGMIGATSFVVGDWLISNGSVWQKIGNSTLVSSVFSRTGHVVAQEGDYNLDLLTDVDLTIAPVAGKVLKFDGTHWVAADDSAGGGAASVVTATIADGAVTDAKIGTVSASKITGTINSAQILDGSIVNADINAAAAIDYSKLNIPNTTIPYAKLNIANGDIPYSKLTVADGEIPAAKVLGIPAVTTVLATTVTDGDTTHAPDGNAVYDSLALKMNTSGGALTGAGTISNVPNPVGPLDVSNRQYTDTKLDKTAGGTVVGSVSFDTDIKLKGTTNYVTLKTDAATAAYTLTLPPSAGTNGYVLTTNGSGVLSWVSASAPGTAMSGDVSGTAGANTIGAGKVTLTHLSATGTKDNTTYLRGDNTWAAFSAEVLAAPLTSLSLATGTAITAADTVLSGMGKLQKQLTDRPIPTGTADATTYHAGDSTWKNFDSSVRGATLTGLSATGITHATRTIAATDSALTAFNKLLFTQGDYVSTSANQTINGSLKINSLTGFIEVPTPVNANEAANKAYVDSYGHWIKGLTTHVNDISYSTGKVGIGTTTPLAQLHIVPGDVKITDTSNATFERQADIYGQGASFTATGALTPSISFYRAQGTLAAPLAVNNADIVGGLGFLAYYPNGTANDRIQGWSKLETYVDEANGWTMAPGLKVPLSLRYSGLDQAGTRITPFTVTANGRVGIGTSTPTTQMQVNGTVKATAFQGDGSGLTGVAAGASGADGLVQFASSGALSSAAGLKFVAPGALFLGTPPSGYGTSGSLYINDSVSARSEINLRNSTTGNTSSDGGNIAQVFSDLVITNVEAGYLSLGTSNSERMRVLANGNVGIGVTTTTYKLEVNGSVAGTTAYATTSDVRFKKDIVKISSALEKLTSLDGVYYFFRNEEFPDKNFSHHREMGVIAQKVEKIFPEAVSKDEKGFRSVAYTMLIAPIIESIKEIKGWLIGHDQELELHKREIASVKEQNARLLEENAAIKSYLCSRDPKASICK